MKLQLRPDAIRRYASLAGSGASTAQNLWNASQRVLDVFCAERHDPFTRRDLAAVLVTCGWDDDQTNTEFWGTLKDILKNYDRVGRGYYTVGSQVGTPLPPLPSATPTPTPPAATKEADVEVPTLKVEEVAGVSWVSPLVTADEARESYYGTDKGLRRVALDETPCFGLYSETHAACAACPLARFCSSTSMGALEALGADLDKATENAIANAKAKIDLAKRRKAEQETRRNAPTPTPAPPPKKKKVKKKVAGLDWPEGFVPMKEGVPFDSHCSGCGEILRANVPGAVHVNVKIAGASRGMYHGDCAKTLAGL